MHLYAGVCNPDQNFGGRFCGADYVMDKNKTENVVVVTKKKSA